jgi:hypothetical protein
MVTVRSTVACLGTNPVIEIIRIRKSKALLRRVGTVLDILEEVVALPNPKITFIV